MKPLPLRPVRRLGFFVIAFVVLLAVAPARAQAQDAGERITSFDFVATIEDDGDLAVQETITYDFDCLRWALISCRRFSKYSRRSYSRSWPSAVRFRNSVLSATDLGREEKFRYN